MSENIHVILGGTSGLGKEITKNLRARGEETWALGSSYNADEHGQGMRVDLAAEQDVDTALDGLRENLGARALASFWLVSGYGYNGDFSEQADPRRMANVNFSNTLPLVQFVWNTMAEQESGGSLAIVSSTTGVRPRANEAVYSATKAALVMLGRSLGAESERLESNVRVGLFLPGGMRTPFWDGTRPEVFDSFNDPVKVAEAMVSAVYDQETHFEETTIERGELT